MYTTSRHTSHQTIAVRINKQFSQVLLVKVAQVAQIFFKIATIYSFSNDCSPSHQFCTDLNILQNCSCLVKGQRLKKIYFIAIASVF